MNTEFVRIFDTTLRDGEQSPGCSMNLAEKLALARQLERLGVDVIEAGFPIASEGDFESVRAIAAELKRASVCGLARTGAQDIERAARALEGFIATSDIHLEHKLRMSREQVLAEVDRAVRQARQAGDYVEVSAEDATRSDVEFLVQVFDAAIQAGASTLNVPDTVGYTQPEEFGALVRELRARQVECTVNGIGERAGNTSMEEVVMAIKTRPDVFQGLDTRIVTTEIYASSRLLASTIGVSVQPNKAVVGDNAFAHEAGIHQDGVLKAPITYEIMTPQSIGRPSNELVLGKHSGRHAFRDRLEELGVAVDGEDFERAFRRFKDLADKKKTIYNEDLEAIVADSVTQTDDRFELGHLSILSGTFAKPTATVELVVDGERKKATGLGIGPVDAVFKAIAELTETKSDLLRYQVNAITGGMDALGEVSVTVSEDGRRVIGHGAHPDIIVASAKAYVHALNKLAWHKSRHPVAEPKGI
jgi:2-isopropylmalate synthase